jgi:hypothetical protein
VPAYRPLIHTQVRRDLLLSWHSASCLRMFMTPLAHRNLARIGGLRARCG